MRWMSALLAAVLPAFLIACDTSASSPTYNPDRYDGQELFTSLMLGQGDAAQLFPEIWGVDHLEVSVAAALRETDSGEQGPDVSASEAVAAIHAPAFVEATSAITDWIAEQDPAFFPAFKRSVESGDPLRVDAALTDGGQRLVEAARMLYASDGDLSAEAKSALNGLALTEGREVGYCIAIAVAVAVVVVVALWVEVTLPSPTPEPDPEPDPGPRPPQPVPPEFLASYDQGLEREVTVALIVERLTAPAL